MEKPNLELTPEEVLALNDGFRILMGAIMKTNKFLLSLKDLNEEQSQEIAIILDIYTSLYNEYLSPDQKDKVIFALTKGKMNS